MKPPDRVLIVIVAVPAETLVTVPFATVATAVFELLQVTALLSAFAEGFNFQVWIFRFVSILGERYSHGHVYDFYKQTEWVF